MYLYIIYIFLYTTYLPIYPWYYPQLLISNVKYFKIYMYNDIFYALLAVH